MSDVATTIGALCESLGVSQAELGARVAAAEGRERPWAQTAVQAWLAGKVRIPPERVFAIERALGVPAGSVSVHAGYLPVGTGGGLSVPEAVNVDPDLTAAQREDLLAVWEVMRARTRARRET